jgi:hypothetical protein
MRLTREQLDFIRKTDSVLYHGIIPGLAGQKDGTLLLDLSKVKQAFRDVFPSWVRDHDIVEPPAPDPELDVLTNPDPDPTPVKQVTSAEETAGIARVEFWRQAGLLDDGFNVSVVTDHIRKFHHGKVSVRSVDDAVNQNRDRLHWEKPAEQVAPTPPAPPTPPVPDLPPVPAYMLTEDNPLRTKKDLGRKTSMRNFTAARMRRSLRNVWTPY